MMATLPIYVGVALAEIAGCFSFWAWLRLDRSPLWLAPGMASLALFARSADTHRKQYCGPCQAAVYGVIYITASLFWPWTAESFGAAIHMMEG